MDIREVLYQLRAGESERAISRQTGLHRKTIRQYHKWAKREGLLSETLPEIEQLEHSIQAQFGKLEAPLHRVKPY